jgi:hypothetical protein
MTGRTDTKTARNRTNIVRTARSVKKLIFVEWPELHERAMKKFEQTKPRWSVTSGAMLF